VIVFGALDNLWKGAASQAVQNLNLMFGLPEDEGIGPVKSHAREVVS
jgi:N-acetyl-gamma-glutamyl-phosphate reductase